MHSRSLENHASAKHQPETQPALPGKPREFRVIGFQQTAASNHAANQRNGEKRHQQPGAEPEQIKQQIGQPGAKTPTRIANNRAMHRV